MENKYTNNRWTETILIGLAFAVLFFCFVAMVLLCLWGQNRGFDIGDESYYAMMAADPFRYRGLSSFGNFLHVLPHLCANAIRNLRMWHLLNQILAAALLAYGVCTWFARFFYTRLTTWIFFSAFLLTAVGNFLIFSIFPQSLSYNSLTTLFISGSICMLLVAMKMEDQPGTRDGLLPLIWLCVSGVFTGMAIFVKPSSGVIQVSLLTFLILFYFRSTIAKLKAIGAFGLGIAGAVFIYFALLDNFTSWYSSILETANYLLGHRTGVDIRSLANECLSSLRSTVKGILATSLLTICGAFFASLVLSWIYKRFRPKYLRIICYFLVLITFLDFDLILVKAGYLGATEHAYEVFYVVGLILLAILIPVQFMTGNFHKWRAAGYVYGRKLLPLIFLGMTPLICALGTSNPMFYQSKVYMGSWFLFVSILSLILSKELNSPLPMALSMCLMVLLALSQFIAGYLYDPYALEETMFAQNENVQFPANLCGLKLSPTKRHFFERLSMLLLKNGYEEGDIILAFENIPGLVFAMNGKSLGAPAYYAHPGYEGLTCKYLSTLREQKPERIYMLCSRRLRPGILRALEDAGYKFPQSFQLLGILTIPYPDPYFGWGGGVTDKYYLQRKLYIYRWQPKTKTTANPISY